MSTKKNSKRANDTKPVVSRRLREAKPVYDCSFKFDDYNEAKKYRFVVITHGDLDLNGAMMLRTWKDVVAYLKQNAELSQYRSNEVLQIFKASALLNVTQSASAVEQLRRVRRRNGG